MPLPPSLSGSPPMGSSPISVPTASPGAQTGALAKVGQARDILNSVISQFPPGSPVHEALMKAVQNLTKHIPPSNEALGVNNTALRDLQQNAQKNAMLQMLQQSQGTAGGGAAAGGRLPVVSPNSIGA